MLMYTKVARCDGRKKQPTLGRANCLRYDH